MGWFDSDYEAQGTTSTSQLAPQRHWKDTYFGELVYENTRTGQTVADNIRNDLIHGISAHGNIYRRRGEEYGFVGKISFPRKQPDTYYFDKIAESRDIVSVDSVELNVTDPRRIELGWSDNYTLATATLPAIYNGKDVAAEVFFHVLIFQYTDGTSENTTINPYAEYQNDKWVAVYTDSGGRQHYYSYNMTELENPVEVDDIDIMPVIALKNGQNSEGPEGGALGYSQLETPYFLNDETSAMLTERRRVVKALGADYDELSESIFEPEPIPEIDSDDWAPFSKTYQSAKNSCELGKATPVEEDICAFNSEEEYRADLLENQEMQLENIKNVTDVYAGLFVSVKSLDIANTVALYYTLEPLMGNLFLGSSRGGLRVVNGSLVTLPAFEYQFDLKSGDLEIEYNMAEYTHVRRYGIVQREWETEANEQRRKGSWRVADGETLTDGDPIAEIYKGFENSSDLGEDPDTGEDRTYDPTGDTMLEILVQADQINGEPTYYEIRMYGLWAKHKIDVLRDGEHGRPAAVAVVGGIEVDWEDNPEYEDIVIFPISYYGFRETPVFMRERLMREAFMLVVDGIQVNEIKWYQQGWFQIVMFIIATVLSLWTSGQSITLYNLMMASIRALLVGVVLKAVLSQIDNALIKTILSIVAGILVGGGLQGIGFNFQTSILAMDATGTYFQNKLAEDMIEYKEKYDAHQKEENEFDKKMTKMEEEAGMGFDGDADTILRLSLEPPFEYADEMLDRSLNIDKHLDVGFSLDLDSAVSTETDI